MANVVFKRGFLADLPNTLTDGVFYLTQDTGRLYADIDVDKQGHIQRCLLNQTIQTAATVNQLFTMSDSWSSTEKTSHEGDFWYVINSTAAGANSHENPGNILVYWDGTNWVQINPDTDTLLTALTNSVSTSSNTATITTSATDTAGTSITSASFSITGSGNVHVSSTNNAITLAGDTYNLVRAVNNDTATLTLNSNNGSTNTAVSTIDLIAGQNVSIAGTSTNGITISSENSSVSNVDVEIATPGSLKVTVEDSGGASADDTLTGVGVSLGNSYYAPITTNTGKTAAEIYSKAEVDALIEGVDGMTIKGTFHTTSGSGTITSLPTSNVHAGDTYVIVEEGLTASDFSNINIATSSLTSGASTSIGDLLIAYGAETNGVIPSANLTWLYIPAGNESASGYTYTSSVDTTTHTISISNGAGTVLANIGLVAGTDISITSASSDSSSIVSTINHATITTAAPTLVATPTAAGSSSFTAIKELTISNGHVTAIKTDTFTPATYSISGMSLTAGSNTLALNGTNDITATVSLEDSAGGNTSSSAVKFKSSTLTITNETPAAAGSTSTIGVELVWGTF